NKLFFSSIPTPTNEGEDDDWLIYQITSNIGEPTINNQVPRDCEQPADNTQSALDRLPIVQVYSRRQVIDDTCPAPKTLSSSNPPQNDLDLPISRRKGKRQCQSIYFIANFILYDHLSPLSSSLVASLDSVSIPKIVKEALSHPGWYAAMLEEIKALDDNYTWELVLYLRAKRL